MLHLGALITGVSEAAWSSAAQTIKTLLQRPQQQQQQQALRKLSLRKSSVGSININVSSIIDSSLDVTTTNTTVAANISGDDTGSNGLLDPDNGASASNPYELHGNEALKQQLDKTDADMQALALENVKVGAVIRIFYYPLFSSLLTFISLIYIWRILLCSLLSLPSYPLPSLSPLPGDYSE